MSPSARQLLDDTHPRICTSNSGMHLWERCFTIPEQQILGGDFHQAYGTIGVPQMWIKLHGGTLTRAVIEVGFAIELLSRADRDWLLRETGEAPADSPEALAEIAKSTVLLLADDPQMMFWHGDEVAVGWDDHPRLWQYLEKLVIAAKRAKGIEREDLGQNSGDELLKHRKHALKERPEMPVTFIQLIEARGKIHRLKVKPADIQIFERGPNDEYVPRRV